MYIHIYFYLLEISLKRLEEHEFHPVAKKSQVTGIFARYNNKDLRHTVETYCIPGNLTEEFVIVACANNKFGYHVFSCQIH